MDWLKKRSKSVNKPRGISIILPKKTKKNAVLVGLNYTGTRSALNGCINDANRMGKTLKSKYKYSNVTVLSDKNITPKNDILLVLDKLVSGDEKYLFFQYSGHGTQQTDTNGDEEDGLDEALYTINGRIITDDQINEVVKKVKKGVKMTIVIDACHSGSIIDLPYQLVEGKVVKVNNNTLDGDIICISGCKDDQVSMDVSDGAMSYGAMSNALQAVLSNSQTQLTWEILLYQVRNELSKNRYAQMPQLTMSRPELINELVNF